MLEDKTQQRKEIDLEQNYTTEGGLASHKEKKIEILKTSTVTEAINICVLVVVGMVGILFMFTVAVGGLKVLNNITTEEVRQ